MTEAKLFAVVVFYDDRGHDTDVSIVPHKWLTAGDLCLWPVKCSGIRRLIENCVAPTADDGLSWKEFMVDIKRKEIDSYSKAIIIEKNVIEEKESGLSQDSATPTKRTRIAKNLYSPSVSPSRRTQSSSNHQSKSSKVTPTKGKRVLKFPTPPVKRTGQMPPREKNNMDIEKSSAQDTAEIALPVTSTPVMASSSNTAIRTKTVSATVHIDSLSSPSVMNRSTEEFKEYWNRLNEDERFFYVGESLFLIRKFLPGLQSRLSTAIDRNNPLQCHDSEDLSVFPISSDEDLELVQNKMKKQKGFKAKIATQLMKRKCGKLVDTAREMCKYLFMDEWAKDFSMFGAKKKRSFVKLEIVAFLISVLDKVFGAEKDTTAVGIEHDIKIAISMWLTHCSTREKKKLRQASTSKTKIVASVPVSDEEDELLSQSLLS